MSCNVNYYLCTPFTHLIMVSVEEEHIWVHMGIRPGSHFETSYIMLLHQRESPVRKWIPLSFMAVDLELGIIQQEMSDSTDVVNSFSMI